VINRFKTALCVSTILSATLLSGACFAQTYTNGQQKGASPDASSQNYQNSPQNWRNSPDNFQNSSQNYQNSSQNWQNSPQNWQNSGSNFNSANGIYDSNGNRAGYAAPRGDGGGINYFNNNGNRDGYQLKDQK
jgi:hypothetical protein